MKRIKVMREYQTRKTICHSGLLIVLSDTLSWTQSKTLSLVEGSDIEAAGICQIRP
jgi:hypothetical protein